MKTTLPAPLAFASIITSTTAALALALQVNTSHADQPVLWWSFDQDAEHKVKDLASGTEDLVEGYCKHVPGVSGSALKPDGFTASINRADTKELILTNNAFTVEAWIAQAAYPWNWCPILSLGRNPAEGFSFKVGPNGDFALGLAVGTEWKECVSEKNVLPLRAWRHVAATFDGSSGIRLHVDGKPVGQLVVTGQFVSGKQAPLRALMNEQPVKPSNIHREHGTLPGWFSIDGLVDEVKLHAIALEEKDITASFQKVGPVGEPPLPPRIMPSGPSGPGRFGAYYTQLKYYEEWDNLWRVAEHPDVIVRFDQSAVRMVFWRGTRYSPAWVSERGLWMADQSVESFYGRKHLDKEGCFEHMQDHQCRYSHVRIIESTPARAVVHWRYAPVSANNHFWREELKPGRGCWVDEYYYVYPDQMAIRNVSWKTGTPNGGGLQFQESLPLTHPGQMMGDVIEEEFAAVANLAGETATLKFCKTPDPARTFPKDLLIQRHNFKSANRPSIIFEEGNRMGHVEDRRMGDRGLNIPGSCNHWPVGEQACDGRTAQAADRPTHFLGFPISGPPVHDKDGRSSWVGLYGMTELSMEDLVFVAKSWNRPPDLKVASEGFVSEGYDRGMRAYVLRRTSENANTLSIRLDADADSPCFNPALVIKNWTTEPGVLKLDGKSMEPGTDYRAGVQHTVDGGHVVVWIKNRSVKPLELKLE